MGPSPVTWLVRGCAGGDVWAPTPAAVWEEWADVLTGEAASAGFAPSGIGSKRPRGDAVAQWAKQFLARHAY